LHLRVDLSDGRYTLVPEGGDEGADEEMHYVDVAVDAKSATRAKHTASRMKLA
jgi:hypothetical protein